MEDRTPLEKIQDDAAAEFMVGIHPEHRADARRALDGFLVRAFDAGVKAVNELNAELAAQAQNW